MRAQWVLVLFLVLASDARAEPSSRPHAITAAAGTRLTMLTGDEVLGKLVIAGSRTWQGRWLAGVRVAGEIGPYTTRIYETQGELGLWLHGSERIDVLLSWRSGYARFDFQFATVDAVVLEHAAEIAYRLSDRTELRIAPLAVTAYFSGMWQLTVGPEVGIAWRL